MESNELATTWRPTAKQRDYLQASMQSGLNRSNAEISRQVGVDRCTLYKWLAIPGFARALDELPREALRLHIPGVLMAMIHKARDGDVAAAKLVLQTAGMLTEKQEAQVHAHLHMIKRADNFEQFQTIANAVNEATEDE